MKALRTLLCAGLLLLGSCSQVFEITPKMIDGRLTFVDERVPDRCVSSVTVVKIDSAQAPDEPHDRWRERTTAWVDHGSYGCDDRLPLVYGQPLEGTGSGNPDDEFGPRPLEVGVAYVAAIGSGTDAEAGVAFRLVSDGRVENLGPVDPGAGAAP